MKAGRHANQRCQNRLDAPLIAVPVPSQGNEIFFDSKWGAAPVRSSPRKHYELLRVGFVSRLESENSKRALDLVPILTSLRDLEQPICLRVVGDGPSAQELLLATARQGNFHDVRMLGFMNREHIYRDISTVFHAVRTAPHENRALSRLLDNI